MFQLDHVGLVLSIRSWTSIQTAHAKTSQIRHLDRRGWTWYVFSAEAPTCVPRDPCSETSWCRPIYLARHRKPVRIVPPGEVPPDGLQTSDHVSRLRIATPRGGVFQRSNVWTSILVFITSALILRITPSSESERSQAVVHREDARLTEGCRLLYWGLGIMHDSYGPSTFRIESSAFPHLSKGSQGTGGGSGTGTSGECGGMAVISRRLNGNHRM
jgi:hypothetical protein